MKRTRKRRLLEDREKTRWIQRILSVHNWGGRLVVQYEFPFSERPAKRKGREGEKKEKRQ